MSGAIPPFLQYAFMAWCSVKAQGQLYFLLALIDVSIQHRRKTIAQLHAQKLSTEHFELT
jgi:hypothetical protein